MPRFFWWNPIHADTCISVMKSAAKPRTLSNLTILLDENRSEFHSFLFLTFPPTGRRRHWFSIEDANILLSKHKPLQQSYLKLFFKLKQEQLLAVQIPLLCTTDQSSSDESGKDKYVLVVHSVSPGSKNLDSWHMTPDTWNNYRRTIQTQAHDTDKRHRQTTQIHNSSALEHIGLVLCLLYLNTCNTIVVPSSRRQKL